MQFLEKGLVAEMVEVMLCYMNYYYGKCPKISYTKVSDKMT